MKTIFIPIYQGHQARNVFRTKIFKLLKENNFKIVIFCKKIKEEPYKKEFGSSQVEIIGVDFPKLHGLNKIMYNVSTMMVNTYTVKMRQLRMIKEDKNVVKYMYRRFLSIVLGNFKITKDIFRYFENKNVYREIVKYFNEYKPNLLFSPNVVGIFDTEFIKAAKKTKTKSVALVNSWDNLSSRGIIRAVPDKLLVHNENVKMDALKFSGVSKNKIEVVGLPHFDFYVTDKRSSKDEFYNRVGIPMDKEIILFCPAGVNYTDADWTVLDQLQEAVANNELDFKAHILVRQPPNSFMNKGDLELNEHVTIDKVCFHFDSNDRNDWEWTDLNMKHLADSVYYSKMLVGYASTITLDAIVFDTPVINIAYEGKVNKPEIDTYRWFYYNTNHYKTFLKHGAIKLAYNKQELIKYINQYYHHPEQDRENRLNLLKEQTWKLDGNSAMRLVNQITKQIYG